MRVYNSDVSTYWAVTKKNWHKWSSEANNSDASTYFRSTTFFGQYTSQSGTWEPCMNLFHWFMNSKEQHVFFHRGQHSRYQLKVISFNGIMLTWKTWLLVDQGRSWAPIWLLLFGWSLLVLSTPEDYLKREKLTERELYIHLICFFEHKLWDQHLSWSFRRIKIGGFIFHLKKNLTHQKGPLL